MTGWYMRFGNWIFKLILLNILWVIFTLLGLVIFGVFPATMALFAVVRRMIMRNDEDIPIFKLFWNTYKVEFFRSNLLGIISLSIGAFLLFDMFILRQLDSNLLNQVLIILVFGLIVAYLTVLIFIFPVFVHYETGIVGYLKYTIILIIGRPFHTIFMLVSLVAYMYVLTWIPGLIPVVGVSLLGLLIMKITFLSLPKNYDVV